ncbi:hypothetical protein [Amphibacillus indicireducens]|uniref:hypothetical protein n=1 Tax=Amphibacillus indicireducens TaxID=1076330 RepID=UPI003CD0A28C
MYLFTKTTVWKDHLLIKEEINFNILEILNREEISLARQIRNLYGQNIEEEMLK